MDYLGVVLAAYHNMYYTREYVNSAMQFHANHIAILN